MPQFNFRPNISQAQSHRYTPYIGELYDLIQKSGQDLAQALYQKLSGNLFFEAVDNKIKTVSLDSVSETSIDYLETDYYNKSSENLGHKMSSDGSISNIPEDRNKNLSTLVNSIDELLDQVRYFKLDDHQKKISEFLIHSVNEKGFLENPESIYSLISLNTGIGKNEIQSVHETLKAGLNPPGVLTSNERESIVQQLDRQPKTFSTITAKEIIGNHWDLFIKKDYQTLANRLHLSVKRTDNPDVEAWQVIESAYKNLERINPAPFNEKEGRFLGNPDILVEEVKGKFVAKCVDFDSSSIITDQGNLSLFSRYKQKLPSNHPDFRLYEDHFRRLEEVKRMLHDRKAKLESVVSFVLNTQSEYLKTQDADKRVSLLQQNVAEQFGYHESTVSKIVNDKLIQMPDGTVANLKEFFERGHKNDKGDRLSRGEVKDRIRDIVRKENPKAPLTDIEIEIKLKEDGVSISASQVGKFRELINIPDARKRKSHYPIASKEELLSRWKLKEANQPNTEHTQSTNSELKL